MKQVILSKTYHKSLNSVLRSIAKAKRSAFLEEISSLLDKVANDTLEPIDIIKYRIHKLVGDKKDIWELHIRNDICIEYTVNDTEINVLDIGSHSTLKLTKSSLKASLIEYVLKYLK